MLSSGILWKIAAGAGVLIVGYCIYFDNKRRSDPLYLQKVKERRKAAKTSVATETRTKAFPINKEVFENKDSIEEFGLNEFHIGQQCLESGDLDNGVKHLALSVVTSPNPDHLMQIISLNYQQVVEMVHLSIPAARKIFKDAYMESKAQKVTPLLNDYDQD